MRRTIVCISLCLVPLTADPVCAGVDRADAGRIQVKNATPFAVEVRILGGQATPDTARLEPDQSFTARISTGLGKKNEPVDEGIGIFATGLEPPVEDVGALPNQTSTIAVGNAGCELFHVIVRYPFSDNGGEGETPPPNGNGNGNEDIFLEVEKQTSPCTALLTRETAVFACSSLGLLSLAGVGVLLGRAPRRPSRNQAEI